VAQPEAVAVVEAVEEGVAPPGGLREGSALAEAVTLPLGRAEGVGDCVPEGVDGREAEGVWEVEGD
jgi:hypothetical protein